MQEPVDLHMAKRNGICREHQLRTFSEDFHPADFRLRLGIFIRVTGEKRLAACVKTRGVRKNNYLLLIGLRFNSMSE
jgi:hypothetical protein